MSCMPALFEYLLIINPWIILKDTKNAYILNVTFYFIRVLVTNLKSIIFDMSHTGRIQTVHARLFSWWRELSVRPQLLPRREHIMCQLKTYYCETVLSLWMGLHVKCYFRPTQVRKIWTMLAKIPIITFQENRSGRRRTVSWRERDTTTLTVTFSNCFSMRFKIICEKILCYWVFLLDTLVQHSGVTIRYRSDDPGIESRWGRDF
jgi:hypothetical protein